MAGRISMSIECAVETCANLLVVPYDTAWAKRWVCPICEDAQLEQQVEALSRQEEARVRSTVASLDRPIKRIADF